jgi:hypothetical protein
MAKFSEQFLRAMTQPSYQEGLFTAAKELGGLRGRFVEGQRQQGITSNLLDLQQSIARGEDPSKAIGLLVDLGADAGTIAQFSQLGMQQRKNVLEEERKEAEATAFASRKKSLSSTAKALGFDDLANRIEGITNKEELKDVAKEIRKAELDRQPSQTPLQRKYLAGNVGIDSDLFDKLNLATVPDSIFNEYIVGQKGDLKPYQKGEKVEFFRVNEAGRVWSDDDGMWVEANQLGLEQAPPQVQRVENIATGMADELAKVGAKNFSEAHENARLAADALGSVNRTLPTIDNMFTGAGAELKLNISRFSRAFGVDVVDPTSIEDTEKYIAESGRRVAQYITNLGAGTGLSDADREYAEKVVAGNITVDAEALKDLLGVIKESAQRTIKNYQDTRSSLEKALGENKSALAFYGDIFVDPGPTPTGPRVPSPTAQSYLPPSP